MLQAAAAVTTSQKIDRVVYFFPFQLLLLHFKKNHLLLVFWVLLFGYTTNQFAARYGVSNLFLYPEYHGEISFVSYGIVGFALGGFILAFNLYTYILHGFRFPVIATLNRPFLKFSLNNFIIPLAYIITFILFSISFQKDQELVSNSEIALNILGFILGLLLFLVFSLFYFIRTNKNLKNYDPSEDKDGTKPKDDFAQGSLHRKSSWEQKEQNAGNWKIETYLLSPFKVNLARSGKHYPTELLKKVFTQNHVNASIFELSVVVSFIVIGLFREHPFFVIPAAASTLLTFTMLLMIISALFSWIKGWTWTFFIAAFLVINFSSLGFKVLRIENKAYGLDYDSKLPDYNAETLLKTTSKSQRSKDIIHTEEILENWKRKAVSVTGNENPKLVILNVSGGGLRSSYWTMNSLLHADSLMNQTLLPQLFMINGSSGGMVGAAYLRELMLRSQNEKTIDIQNEKYRENISKDLLNPMLLTIATNDLFIRPQSLEYNGRKYTKDRAYSFEQQLHLNTEGILEKSLGDYKIPEYEAKIPMMIFTPTIVNDGRRMLISPQPISYLCENGLNQDNSILEDIEFRSLFKDQGADELRYSSALRMNATFPYILPMVSLPTEPSIEVMDAGLRDNYGMKTTLQFLNVFQSWIEENTSGVVIIQIQDTPRGKTREIGEQRIFKRLTQPLGSVYGNFTRVQEFTNEVLYDYLKEGYSTEIDLVSFELLGDKESEVSLSWHLTQKEKEIIEGHLSKPGFEQSFSDLKSALSP